jgi:hypothetical protein
MNLLVTNDADYIGSHTAEASPADQECAASSVGMKSFLVVILRAATLFAGSDEESRASRYGF